MISEGNRLSFHPPEEENHWRVKKNSPELGHFAREQDQTRVHLGIRGQGRDRELGVILKSWQL